MQSLATATPAYVDSRQYFPVTPVWRQVWKKQNAVDLAGHAFDSFQLCNQFAANLGVVLPSSEVMSAFKPKLQSRLVA